MEPDTLDRSSRTGAKSVLVVQRQVDHAVEGSVVETSTGSNRSSKSLLAECIMGDKNLNSHSFSDGKS